MEWKESGIILRFHAWGEKEIMVTALCAERGLIKSLCWAKSHHLFPGAESFLHWRGPQSHQLGRLYCEDIHGTALSLIHFPYALRIMEMMCVLCAELIPPYTPMQGLYHGFLQTIEQLPTPSGLISYGAFESFLLKQLGYASESFDRSVPFAEIKDFCPQESGNSPLSETLSRASFQDLLDFLIQKDSWMNQQFPQLQPFWKYRRKFFESLKVIS